MKNIILNLMINSVAVVSRVFFLGHWHARHLPIMSALHGTDTQTLFAIKASMAALLPSAYSRRR